MLEYYSSGYYDSEFHQALYAYQFGLPDLVTVPVQSSMVITGSLANTVSKTAQIASQSLQQVLFGVVIAVEKTTTVFIPIQSLITSVIIALTGVDTYREINRVFSEDTEISKSFIGSELVYSTTVSDVIAHSLGGYNDLIYSSDLFGKDILRTSDNYVSLDSCNTIISCTIGGNYNV